MSATIIHCDVNMTGQRVMVFARIVLVLPLVTHVTNVCLTTMKRCCLLTIQIDVKVSSGMWIFILLRLCGVVLYGVGRYGMV